MVQAIAPVQPALQPAPAVRALVTRPQPAASSLSRPDQLQLSNGTDLKAQLAPVFALIEQAGYGSVANRLRRANFRLTEGKAFGMEYYAAAWVGGVVTFNRNALRDLSQRELAAVLIHEGTHLQQNLTLRGLSNVLSLGGRQMRHNYAEREAYLVQWEAMRRLGITSGEIYYACLYALDDMGTRPADAPADA